MIDCIILISTCDKYQDVWAPFFHFFKKNWEECPFPIYLNTETKKYIDSDIKVTTINCPKKDASWSLRLKNALKSIDSEYIIFLLEDFFLLDKVNQSEIDRCLQIMKEDKSISCIDFECCPNLPQKSSEYAGYNIRLSNAPYFLNCQAAIWRRKDLIKFLNPYENPWQFEIYGSERAKFYNKRFLLSADTHHIPFKYNVNWSTGYGLHGGKWLKSNIDFFKSEGLNVDFSKMGFYEGNNVDTTCPPPKKSLKWKWMYFLYGGFSNPRTPISKQLKYIFTHPRFFIHGILNKFKFIFS